VRRYWFGLIGNPQLITHTDINGGNPISLNNMGSAGRSILSNDIHSGQIPVSDLDIFSLTGPDGEKFYNQWAAILFNNSKTVYGFAYSDFLQPVALHSTSYNSIPVRSWTVTVLPESGRRSGANRHAPVVDRGRNL